MVLRRTLLITAFADQMSSQLTNLVPVLDGTNYQQWASAMQSFLMSQGQWKCTKLSATTPVVTGKGKGKETKDDEAEPEGPEVTESDLAAWLEDAEKALGNIRLRLHHTIAYQFDAYSDPAVLWYALSQKYAKQGISRAFIEFKTAMDTVIPNNADPSPAIDKIEAAFTVL